MVLKIIVLASAKQLKRKPLGRKPTRMINPELNDWWSRNHRTDIRYKETSLSGAGVSMQVIQKAFIEKDYLWFSKIYGGFDDNLLIFGLKQNSKFVENASKYPETDKKRLFFGKPFINEFQITDEIVKLLGLTTTNKGYEISKKDNIEQFIYSHDNFIFYIEPINDVVVHKVLRVILQQHSYYLGKVIDWKKVEDKLIELLKKKKRIDLQSDPRRQVLWMPQMEANRHIFWKYFRRGTIIIRNNHAVFNE